MDIEDFIRQNTSETVLDIFRNKLWQTNELYITKLARPIDVGGRFPLDPREKEGYAGILGSVKKDLTLKQCFGPISVESSLESAVRPTLPAICFVWKVKLAKYGIAIPVQSGTRRPVSSISFGRRNCASIGVDFSSQQCPIGLSSKQHRNSQVNRLEDSEMNSPINGERMRTFGTGGAWYGGTLGTEKMTTNESNCHRVRGV